MHCGQSICRLSGGPPIEYHINRGLSLKLYAIYAAPVQDVCGCRKTCGLCAEKKQFGFWAVCGMIVLAQGSARCAIRCGPVAQGIEHCSPKAGVARSNRAGVTINMKNAEGLPSAFFLCRDSKTAFPRGTRARCSGSRPDPGNTARPGTGAPSTAPGCRSFPSRRDRAAARRRGLSS